MSRDHPHSNNLFGVGGSGMAKEFITHLFALLCIISRTRIKSEEGQAGRRPAGARTAAGRPHRASGRRTRTQYAP